ncbi:MAG: SRPBCC domain-containing protein [Candidatus Zixiibacteriota bacterium]
MAAKFSYDWTQFCQKIEIQASPERVFKAWTEPKTIVKWFVVKAEMEPRRNGRLQWEWLAGDKLDARIIDIKKPGKFVFPFGSKGEKVAVTIRKQRRGSLVELHQYDMKASPRDRVQMHLGCREGWAFFLSNLKAFLEHGVDLRSHDPAKSYRQGFVNS